MDDNNVDAEQLLNAARAARQSDNQSESVDYLRSYLQYGRALLWFSKLSQDALAARAAAELAFWLDQTDEQAQKAVATAQARVEKLDPTMLAHHELARNAVMTTGMTLREAYAVIWPFRDIHTPIGDALEQRTITLRDLAWALEHTTGPIQKAARTILFTRVAGIEPAHAPKPVAVIQGVRYTEQQERRSLVLAAMLASIALVGCLLLVVAGIWSMVTGNTSYNCALLLVLGPTTWLLERAVKHFQETTTNYRLGRYGEEQMIEHFRSMLDDSWTLFRNVVLPGAGGDIDMILVGPGGLWVFEVKSHTGTVRVIEDQWQYQTKRGWRSLSKHPSRQARAGAARLKTFLDQHHLGVRFVEPAILWASSHHDKADTVGDVIVIRSITPVWRSDEIADHLDRLITHERVLAQELVTNIVHLLNNTLQTARSLKNTQPGSAQTR